MDFDRVLIVDDSATSRMIIRRCCEIAGMVRAEFLEAEDGLRALSVLQEQTVDLILSDLRMPKMDGGTFIRKLGMKEDTRDIPVVVVSSIGNDAMERLLLATGSVRGIIKKPISPEKVVEVVGGVT